MQYEENLTPVFQELRGVHLHENLCLIYDQPQEWQDFLLAFVKIGLQRGEKCYYIHDTHTAKQVRDVLRTGDAQLASSEAAGQLVIHHGRKVYINNGLFSPENLLARLIEETKRAIAEGCKGLRIAGEMAWVLNGNSGYEKFVECAALLNRDFFPLYPSLAIWQYNRLSYSPEFIKDVVLTHSRLVRNNHVYANSYYISPEDFLKELPAQREAEYWLNNIAREDRRERELKNNTNRMQMLFNEAPFPLMIMDENWHCTDANKASLDFFECPREDLQAKTLRDYVSPGIPEKLKFESGGISPLNSFEMRYPVKGSVKTLNMSIVSVIIGKEKIIYGIGEDITRRKEVEKALEKTEQQYREIFANTSDAVFLVETNPNGHFGFVSCNPAAALVIGTTIDGGLAVPVEKCFKKEVRDILVANYGRCIKTGARIRYNETFDTREGERNYDTTLVPLKDAAGEVYRIMGVAHDITERKPAKETAGITG
jgi:two-component system, sensor histidine kinase PdtaS